MKKSLMILSVLTFTFFSCETESIETQIEENAALSAETKFTKGLGLGGPSNPYESHERSLEWAAYTSAIVMRKDQLIRQAVIDFVDPVTKTISAEDLLGSNPVSQAFKTDFEYYFGLLLSCSADPAQGTGCPGGDDSPDGNVCPPCNPLVPGGEAQIMIDYLIEYCTEFYFPRGNNTTDTDNIMALGHPMTTDNFNEGFIVKFSLPQNEHISLVHPNHVQTNEMTYIVARPKRDLGIIECRYSDIIEVQFTDFLDGNWPFIP